jgi:hypothetical protein
MKRFALCICVYLVSCAPIVAQVSSDSAAVYVDAADIKGGQVRDTSTTTKLFLGGQELSVSSVENVSTLPLHLVFLLDAAPHQQDLMQLAMSYVAALAADVHNVQATYTVVAAGKNPRVMAEADTASDLADRMSHIDMTKRPSGGEAEGLYDGAFKAVSLLNDSPGGRSVVIFSDNDDDIDAKGLQNLKTQMAASHVRCFNILLASHDFYGSKAKSAAGLRLNKLANFSGGAQYLTNWQNRQSDFSVLRSVAARLSSGSLITFTLPQQPSIKPGIYNLKAQSGVNGKILRTSPLALVP